jgi:hypothetical protein
MPFVLGAVATIVAASVLAMTARHLMRASLRTPPVEDA